MINLATSVRAASAWPEAAWAAPRLRQVQRAARPPAHVPSLVEAGAWAVDREYVRRGGLARGDELLELVRARCDQPISRVARWIVGREVVQYRSGLDSAFPLFQFDLSDMSVRPAVRRAVGELASVLEDFELAQWFVRPNAALAGSVPADVIDCDPDAVIQTARTDRFIAKG